MRYTILAIVLVLSACATVQERCAKGDKWKEYGSLAACHKIMALEDAQDETDLRHMNEDYQKFQLMYQNPY